MNITTQATITPKIKHVNNILFQAIPSSSSRLRLNDARSSNERIKPFATKTFTIENISFNMICCHKGVFTMGLDNMQNNPKRIEQIEHPFLLGETEVTQELYQAVMGYNPSYFDQNGAKKPVEQVNWYEAIMFCNKLSEMLGKRPYYEISNVNTVKNKKKQITSANIQINENSNGFRLPTEKEWEYAAKAGTNNEYAGCDNEAHLKKYGWYDKNSNNSTQSVKTRLPNEWGFYDMSGNVGEWCWDKYDKYYDTSANRVHRGGSWSYYASDLRSALRGSYSPCYRYAVVGCRVSASLVN
jgi:sulfatase modifying factor 1